MKGVNVAVKSTCENYLFRGIKIPNGGPSISHLFYAEDAIFVGEWSEDGIKNLFQIFKCFHIASMLKVNSLKSRLLGVDIPNSELHHMASILACCEGNFPFTYLDVPMSANMALQKY